VFRLGFAPITWNNEDLTTELGEPVAYTTLLDEVVEAGYAATELGDGFPRDPAELRRALSDRGMALPSAWCGLALRADSAESDVEHTRRVCALVAEVGGSFINLAHQGTTDTLALAGQRPGKRLSDDDWNRIADRVTQAAEIARAAGLQPLFHVHAGTLVETHADMQQLLNRVPADTLKLCWDVGHALYGGIDPVAVVREHPDRIAYLHLKDLDRRVFEELRHEHVGFLDAVRRRVFTELGHGALDVPGLLKALREIDYDGWLMVEQDSTWLSPIESARTSRAFLKSFGI
jgi:inosose dehydratase